MAFFNDFEKYDDHIALVNNRGERLSYRKLNQICREMGNRLTKRTLVFSFCENSIGSVCGYVSFLYNQVVPVLLDRHMEKGLRSNLLSVYRPDYLYLPEEMLPDFAGMQCIWRGRGYCLCKTSYDTAEFRIFEELALLLTTSGSTGSPKLVRQSYGNIQANAESIAQYLQITAQERPITTLPMNYTYGLSVINSHLLCGATIIVTDDMILSRKFWELFKKEEATSFGGVPYTFEMLKKLRFFRMALPSLRYITQAGGKLSPGLHKEFAQYAKEQGKRFIVMYGQCEATARMGYLPAEKSLEKCGSMGIAIPGGRLELTDVAGNVIEQPDVVGELVYYGANVTLGYAQDRKDLEKGDERFGRLETGDMAKRDEDGFYYITGRKKRFLKVFGIRINLDELERMVKAYAEDYDCACAGSDDHLYVFLTSQDKQMQEKVRRFLAQKTNLHSSAFTILYIGEVPKNEAGKTLYSKLEKYYSLK